MAAVPGYAATLVREFELPRLGTAGLRLRVWCTRTRLTRALAAGACAVDSRELALRAGQITDGRTRALLAASIDDLLDQAEGARATSSAQADIDRHKVLLAQVPLRELAERMRSPDSVTPRGMAHVLLLLTDPAEPLYGPGDAVDVAGAVIQARQLLDGVGESRLEL